MLGLGFEKLGTRVFFFWGGFLVQLYSDHQGMQLVIVPTHILTPQGIMEGDYVGCRAYRVKVGIWKLSSLYIPIQVPGKDSMGTSSPSYPTS